MKSPILTLTQEDPDRLEATTSQDVMSKKKQIKGDWIVRMKCMVIKDVYVDNCTEEEARNNPFELASNEIETDMRDWEVESIEEVK